MSCKIGYPSETHLKPKSREISLAHDLFLSYAIVLKFFTEHGSGAAVFCATFGNEWSTEVWIIGNRDFARFGFKMSFCFWWISYITQHPWFSQNHPQSHPHNMEGCYISCPDFGNNRPLIIESYHVCSVPIIKLPKCKCWQVYLFIHPCVEFANLFVLNLVIDYVCYRNIHSPHFKCPTELKCPSQWMPDFCLNVTSISTSLNHI